LSNNLKYELGTFTIVFTIVFFLWLAGYWFFKAIGVLSS